MMIEEKVGDNFSQEKYMSARAYTIKAVHTIASKIEEGMSEKDGHDLIEQVLKEMSYERHWHPPKFRIGPNTTKSFREISEKNVKLEKEDLFFIDIGPVWENHEGDYGETFGGKNLPGASRHVFDYCVGLWQEKKLTGIDLYLEAQKKAEQMGFFFNTQMAGHRLGDFPHALFHKGPLKTYSFCPSENLWVLEIHLIDPRSKRGAFFEDIMGHL